MGYHLIVYMIWVACCYFVTKGEEVRQPSYSTVCGKILLRQTAARWDDRIQKFNEARRANDYSEIPDRCDAVQLFTAVVRYVKEKVVGNYRMPLCGERTEDWSHVLFSCGESDGIRGTDWSDFILQEALLGTTEKG
ncbi:hypothetical protein PoB_000073300 [Plakobranchus ocellatus]|uniref:SCP domain-containing protein n=1 Tax=Plakobranchus ocellatus TaxID=259542 RepID=A0AAV3XW67_9GAST|nr:hypothetical protein PoB_000073300 [Plakobranchus ocellatus]